LPNATANNPYSQSLVASGGAGQPYTYAVGSGALPNGLTLNPQTGVISGTPTSAGSANFTITATDGQGVTGSQGYSITVAAPTGTLQPVSGDRQVALPATPVPQNFVAKVVNGQGNPVQGAAVTWSVQQGGGTISAATLISDAQGLVHAGYTTGADPQNDNIVRVTATGSGSSYDFIVRNLQQRVVVPAKQLIGPMAQVAVNTPTIQLNNIRQRLDQLRMQNSPTIAEGFRVSYDGRSLPPMSAFALVPLDKDGKPQRQTGAGASADQPDSFERWGVFVNGDVDVGRQTATETQTGFKVTSKGITLGGDYRFPGNNVLGASVGFLKADTDLDAGAGTQSAKGYSFSLYGSYVPQQNAYIDGILNVGHNKYDSNRQASIDSFRSSTNGNQWGLAVSAGYAFNRGPLALTPYGRVEYVDAKVNGFSESGNPDAALVINGLKIAGTTLTLGGQASYAISTSWGVLLPNARLELQHLAQRSADDVSARIVNQDVASPSAQIPILGEDRNFGNFAVGVSAVFPRGVSAFFNYQQLFGKDNLSDRHYTLELRVAF
jgi:outer membrane autotransporter protein